MTPSGTSRPSLLDALAHPLAQPTRSLVFWGAAAVASLAFACAVAVQPARSLDYWELRAWLEVWGWGLNNPYTYPGLAVDYPPHGLMLLYPLRWLPHAQAAEAMAAINVALSVVAAWLAVRTTSDYAGVHLGRVPLAATMAIMLSFGGIRTTIWLGQTMPIAFVLAMLAVHQSDRRPILAGIALGLATFKPNLAIGFALALLLLRHFRVVAIGAVTVALLTLVFAEMLDEPVIALTRQYVANLSTMYGSRGYVADWLGMRAVIRSLVRMPEAGELLYALYLLGSLVALVALTWRTSRERATRAIVLAASLLWALQGFSHQRFNIVLAVPGLFLLMPGIGLLSPDGWRRPAFAGLVVFLALDIPLVLRLLGSSGYGWWPVDLTEFARLLGRAPAMGLLAYLMIRLNRQGTLAPK